jgi:ankyrin repeat protein
MQTASNGTGALLTEQRASDEPGVAEWFRGSKIIDSAGRPLTVYHGTEVPFDGQFKRQGNTYLGIYGSSDMEYSKTFGPVVKPLNFSVKSPFVLDLENRESPNFSTKEGEIVIDGKIIGFYRNLTPETIEELKERGYDGIVANYRRVNGFEVVAFDPDQVRPAASEPRHTVEAEKVPYRVLLQRVQAALREDHPDNQEALRADLSDLASRNNTALQEIYFNAVKQLDGVAIKRMLTAGMAPATENFYGENAMHVAANAETIQKGAWNRVAVMELLRAGGVDPRKASNRGDAPVHTAAAARNSEALNYLLDLDEGVRNERNAVTGDTPLHCASRAGALDNITLLYRRGANGRSQNVAGEIPLHKTIIHSVTNPEAVAAHLENGADPMTPNSAGNNCFDLFAYADGKRSEKDRALSLMLDHTEGLPGPETTMALMKGFRWQRKRIADRVKAPHLPTPEPLTRIVPTMQGQSL